MEIDIDEEPAFRFRNFSLGQLAKNLSFFCTATCSGPANLRTLFPRRNSTEWTRPDEISEQSFDDALKVTE